MKKKIISFILAIIITVSFDVFSFADGPAVSAQSAVLMCANNGKVLYSKNEAKRLSMASTTKIMTSLLAIEAAIPDKEIVVTSEMVSVEGTSMGLVEGDSVSVKELVYGMLLQSGNDAANTVAYVLGGSPEGFAEMMNNRADEIGMKNTNFVTASGLDSKEHYSTAYDMALLACESISNPEFASICSKKSVRVTYGNPPYARTLTNHNRLLWSYDDAIGIKTGFTKKSGRCLVSAAERNGITLVAVTLNAPDDWNDHISMFEYGFSKYKGVELTCRLPDIKVAGGEKESVSVRLSSNPMWIENEDCNVRIFIRPFLYAPVEKDYFAGTAVFYSDEKIIAEIPLLTNDSVEFRKAPVEPVEEKGLFSDLINITADLFNIPEVK